MQPTGCLRGSSLSVETRRRYGWLRMVFPGMRPFRAPIWCTSGGWRHARGREHCVSRRASGSTLSSGYAPNSEKAEGGSIVDEPGDLLNPCARESTASTGRFLREKLMSDHGHFLPTRATTSGEQATFVGLFQGCTGLWTAGCRLARRLHGTSGQLNYCVQYQV